MKPEGILLEENEIRIHRGRYLDIHCRIVLPESAVIHIEDKSLNNRKSLGLYRHGVPEQYEETQASANNAFHIFSHDDNMISKLLRIESTDELLPFPSS